MGVGVKAMVDRRGNAPSFLPHVRTVKLLITSLIKRQIYIFIIILSRKTFPMMCKGFNLLFQVMGGGLGVDEVGEGFVEDSGDDMRGGWRGLNKLFKNLEAMYS